MVNIVAGKPLSDESVKLATGKIFKVMKKCFFYKFQQLWFFIWHYRHFLVDVLFKHWLVCKCD